MTKKGFKNVIKEIIFKNKACDTHNNLFDYSLVNYVNSYTKVKIICPIHGVFHQEPKEHIRGRGCRKCFDSRILVSQNDVIKEFHMIHGDRYDYSRFVYERWNIKSEIICTIHGLFLQNKNNHCKGKGCPDCGNINSSIKQRSTKKEFVMKSNITHNYYYSYNKVNYINNYTNIIITCPKHGDFEQEPKNHLNGKGCSICRLSKGELKIIEYLEVSNIEYQTQKGYLDLLGKDKKRLKFDFYLTEYDCLIEYDGAQHYKPVDFFGGNKAFKRRQHLDKLKTQYCIANNIQLIRIPYWDSKNIKSILDKNINI